MRRFAIVAFACVLAGCGQDAGNTSDPSTSGGMMSESAAAPAEAPDAPVGLALQPDPTIVDPHPIRFTSWTKLAGDRIAVHFEIGSPSCYGVDATTTETPTTVTVALRSGTKPAAVGKMCTMLAAYATVEIPLHAPLGNRTVKNP